VVPLEVHDDLLGAKVVVLPKVQDLPDDVDVGRVGAGFGPLGAGAQPVDAIELVAAVPDVVGLQADALVAAGHRDVTGDFLDVVDDRQASPRFSVQRRDGLRHR
jgi:hypothetical protein